MDEKSIKDKDFFQLARLASTGKTQDVHLLLRRLAHRYEGEMPELASLLTNLVREVPNSKSVLRGTVVDAMPVDMDSRLQLARTEYPVVLDSEPIWTTHVKSQLDQIVLEQVQVAELHKADLYPTKSALFTGPPGVGKTLAAKWLASKLNRPLIVLDLAAVMSSFLGRTGNNVRNILDYAKGVHCVFLLDEFDAIAKRRDDVIEIGELKRLVTVLLQEIDEWPNTGLLIAATNHKELLDPAVWRRFEMLIDFPMPTLDEVKQTIELHLQRDADAMRWSDVLARALYGLSYAEVGRELMQMKRQTVLRGQPAAALIRCMVLERIGHLDRKERTSFALKLLEAGLSQRETHEWTGVSRDTIRKAVRVDN
jgi:SpoVK/Ycf46/Vps4 family AAA+-type ATPase